MHCRSISRDRGLRAVLEAAGSVAVLFCLSWHLAPVLATVIVGTAVAATVYRKVAKGIEARLSAALRRLSRVAGQAFTNIRTVRAFAGAPPPCPACALAACPGFSYLRRSATGWTVTGRAYAGVLGRTGGGQPGSCGSMVVRRAPCYM